MGLQLGKYIKNCRQEKKMAVKTLAKATGISKSYLDYIEAGAREPQVEMLAKIPPFSTCHWKSSLISKRGSRFRRPSLSSRYRVPLMMATKFVQ